MYVTRWGEVVALVEESAVDQLASLTGELGDEALAQVAGGIDGPPNGPGDKNAIATPILF